MQANKLKNKLVSLFYNLLVIGIIGGFIKYLIENDKDMLWIESLVLFEVFSIYYTIHDLFKRN